jgi:uncharacterized delta-60 repeat protein
MTSSAMTLMSQFDCPWRTPRHRSALRSTRLDSDSAMKAPADKAIAAIFLLYVIVLPLGLRAAVGGVDVSFDPGSGANGRVNAIAAQSDGRILIGGTFTLVNGVNCGRIARLNSDGSLDGSFNPGSGANDDVSCVAVQRDGKVLMGGNFHTFNGTTRVRIARLNSDGSLDGSFDTGFGANSRVNCMALQEDGKVLVGGSFSTINGTNRYYIARLHTDGSLDTSFDSRPNYYVFSIAVQPDGKVLCGGLFSAVNDVSRYRIARLNSDGSLDGTFGPMVDPGAGKYVGAIVLQADGKALISGNFTEVNNATRNYIARLNPNGTLDGFYATPNGTVYCMARHWDGKVLIGGFFTMVGGASRQCVARLCTDGVLDEGFSPGSGASGPDYPSVLGIAVQSDGRAVIGGNFTAINGTGRNFIARLLSDGLNIRLSESAVVLAWPTNLCGFTLQSAENLTAPVDWSDCTNVPVVMGAEFMSTNAILGSGQYYRLKK